MGVLRPHALAGFIDGASEDVARALVDGDGILWAGDPNLSLHVGTITAGKSGWSNELNRQVRIGEVVARRWEVWRHTEDGEDVRIGTWKMEDLSRIIMDIAPLRLDSPGHVDTLAEIDKANDKLEADRSQAFKEAAFELLDHQIRLHHDLTQPKNRFYMNDIKQDDTAPVSEPHAD